MIILHTFFLLNRGDKNSLKGWGGVGKLENLVTIKKPSFNICYLVSVCLEGSGLYWICLKGWMEARSSGISSNPKAALEESLWTASGSRGAGTAGQFSVPVDESCRSYTFCNI